MNKKKKSIYENSFWYLNTYKSLGSEWLIKSIIVSVNYPRTPILLICTEEKL